jgi:hypothetical protein
LVVRVLFFIVVAVVLAMAWFGGWIPHALGLDEQGADSTPPRPHGLASKQLVVAGLRFRSSEEQVFQAIGRPDVASPPRYDPSLGDSVSNWQYDGILVLMKDHGVVKVHCSATRCATANDVAVGDSRDKVIRTYGTPRTIETADEKEMLRYAGTVAECSLNFTIKDGSVSTIDLACDGS